MRVRFAIVSAYPSQDWHSRQIVQACAALGQVQVFAPSDLGLRVQKRNTAVMAGGHDARTHDVWLLPRALGPTGDPDFQLGMYRILGELGAPVVNPVDALLLAEDKIATSVKLARAGIATPDLVCVQSVAEAAAALVHMRRAVVKPPYGSLGIGVARVGAREPSTRRLLSAALAAHRVIYLQRFVGHARRKVRDLRVFVVGGEVAAAMVRVAPPGEFRTNVHQGGQGHALVPDRELGRAAVRATQALGLEYAGVDLIETEHSYTVIEVNGTPSWRGLHEVTGQDMAVPIAAHARACAAARQHTQHPQPRGAM